jgi:predicted metal-binding membrane protein
MTDIDATAPFAAAPPHGTHSRRVPWSRTLRRMRRTSGRHPEWWMMLVSVAAWAFLASPYSHAGRGGARGWGDLAAVTAMVVAMMLPLAIGRAGEVARSGTRRRHRAAGAFVAGYLAVWVLAMITIDIAFRLLDLAAGWTAAAGVAVAAAVLWEITPRKWRRWRRRDEPALPPGAEHADAGSTRLGVTAAGNCVGSCWALMAACVVFAHSLPVMAAFFALQLHGRHRRPASPAVMALAVLGVCVASLALTRAGHHHHPGS